MTEERQPDEKLGDLAQKSADAITQLLGRVAELEQQLDEARAQGMTEMLDMVRASLKGYPGHGGDIEVMGEVDRIRREGMREAAEIIKNWPSSHIARSEVAGAIERAALKTGRMP